ncbi:DUF2769 domain-containing protein [Candidatus Woesearchaeota archaeon]|nr:DUF2769 domain-containing protein [Candidatus Woesearchaeota archaeon]
MKKKDGKCICPECPSFVECRQLAFCFKKVGKSKCIKEEKGCLCPGCPVQAKMNFKHAYYCTRGCEEDQSQ